MAVNTTVQVTLPQMGESVTEGTVLEWHKQEGERVEADEVLVEISTDKVDAEVPSPASGTVVKIHAAEGDTVSVGAVLAEIATENGAGPTAASGNGDAPAAQSDAPAAEAAPPEAAAPDGGAAPAAISSDGDDASATTATPAGEAATTDGGDASTTAAPAAPEEAAAPTGDVVDIVTPTGGESVTEGTILEWAVKVGDSVEDGQTVVELSTDKVDMELPAPAAGTITEILAEEGETVTVGQVIARMQTGAPAERPAAEPHAGNGAGTAAPTPQPTTDLPERISPVAARVAAAEGVDLSAITGTGPGGRITKTDVLEAKNGGTAPAPAPTAEAAGERTLMKGGAAMLARYMDESRAIPTATSFRTITVTAMDTRRKQLKDAGQKVSFTHLIAYAIAQAAQHDMPVMAHHFDQADGKSFRVDDGQVNLGIAVDVEKKDGSRTLMVPVILDAGRKSFADFKAAFDALIEKARTNTLTADDLARANISLTNPGGIGTIASVPRLMVGQGTIVATGAIGYPPGLQNIGEAVGAEKVMTMTSTYDHRIIQGAESGRFLQVVEAYLQGENGFYDGVFASLGAELGPPPVPPQPTLAPAPAPAAPAPAAAPAADEQMLQAVQAATSLLKAHRTHGHLAARLDPLGTEPEGDPALEPSTVALTPEIMARIPAKILRMYVPGATLAEALPHLRETYCGTIAYEIEHISDHQQRVWLRNRVESGKYRRLLSPEEKKRVL
ncbi:MAG TPA: biotin/lipoyl-containing protein, partial [Solirubrobacteraceae bacterium]|nr:biotin/lipoyl-containing protein [Solirubrobacteraceae bacterium]